MTMAAMCMAVCASAQVYIGGSAALGGQKHGDGDSKMVYKLMPEIGYQFNKTWDAGLSVGYAGVEDGNNAFVIAPYARYTFVNTKLVDLFLEGTVGYVHSEGVDGYEIGLKPGVKVNLSKNVSFVTKVGFLGYQQVGDGNAKVKTFGFDLDGTNVQFGLNYKF